MSNFRPTWLLSMLLLAQTAGANIAELPLRIFAQENQLCFNSHTEFGPDYWQWDCAEGLGCDIDYLTGYGYCQRKCNEDSECAEGRSCQQATHDYRLCRKVR